MKNLHRLFLALMLIGSFFVVSADARATMQHIRGGLTPIQHIIWITKENRTFDNYFGGFSCADGSQCVNGASTGKVKVNGIVQTIPLGPFVDKTNFDYNHSWQGAHTAYDKGAMDKFNTGNCAVSPYPCYQVAQPSDIPNYWAYAQNYLLADNAYSELEGPSYPNHLYTLAAASGPDIAHSAIGNPSGKWTCDAAVGTSVLLYNGTRQFPCFSMNSLPDEMTTAGISWKFYAPQANQAGYNWNQLDSLQDQFGSPNDVQTSQFLTDAANNALPQFSWIVPPGPDNEHPGSNRSVCTGENWTVKYINAVMNSPAWANTVIIMSWDDYGGFYDHVVPTGVDALGYGFRVPMLVISPYAHADDNSSEAHVSHDMYSFASVLRLAEDVYGLPALTQRDANAGSLLQALDFSQVWNPPMVLQPRVCPTTGQPDTGANED